MLLGCYRCLRAALQCQGARFHQGGEEAEEADLEHIASDVRHELIISSESKVLRTCIPQQPDGQTSSCLRVQLSSGENIRCSLLPKPPASPCSEPPEGSGSVFFPHELIR
jgi:hypothetical protein